MIAAAAVLGERSIDLVGEPQWIVAVIFDLGHWVVPDAQWSSERVEHQRPARKLVLHSDHQHLVSPETLRRLALRRLPFFVLCCGRLFATTSTALSKRGHASGSISNFG